jgi:hypothetical protein
LQPLFRTSFTSFSSTSLSKPLNEPRGTSSRLHDHSGGKSIASDNRNFNIKKVRFLFFKRQKPHHRD